MLRKKGTNTGIWDEIHLLQGRNTPTYKTILGNRNTNASGFPLISGKWRCNYATQEY